VKCKGATIYREKGADRTEIHIKGVLELSLKGLLPGLIARRAEPAVESFVIKLIQPNFEKTNDAVIQYLRAKK
jgi:hypothetical protein